MKFSREKKIVPAALAVLAVLAQPIVATAQQSQIGEVTLFGEEEFKIQAATKTEIPISKAPGAVTVISARQIRESGARTIPELLRRVAGVNVRWNPMVQTVDMRSFGQNPFSSRVLLLIDGVPYNSWNKGGFPQHPGFDFFGLQNVKRIEVLRGPGSALYGENAYWGVVNIVTLSGEDLAGGKIELYGGDVETRSAGVVYGKKVGEAGSILVSGKFLQSQLPMVFWAEENDSQVRGTDVFLKGSYKGLGVSYYRHEDELDGFNEPIPIPGLPPVAFASIDKIKQEIDIFAVKYGRKLRQERVSLDADFSYAQRTGSHCAACHAAPQDPNFRETDEGHGFQLIGDLRLGLHMLPGHDILIGVEARKIDAGDHGDELLDPALAGGFEKDVVLGYSKVAVYVQDQISFADDSFGLILGARYDGSNDLFGDEISPRVSAVYSPTEALVLRAGWSQAFRFPNFSELYQNSWFFNVAGGPVVIPFSVFQPNPDLEPEQLETVELGLQYRISPALSVKIDLYQSVAESFAVMVFEELPGAPTLLRIENHPDDATIRGVELELRWAAKRGLTGFFNWSYSETGQDGNLVDTSGKPFELVYAPENKLNLGLYFGPFGGLSGEVDLQWRDDYQAPSFWNELRTGSDTIAKLDGYTLANLRLSYDLPVQWRSGRHPLRLSVHGRNLLDEQPTETLVGVDTRLLGRTFYGSFELSF